MQRQEDDYGRIIRNRYPNYDRFTVADFERLTPGELRAFSQSIAVGNFGDIIPQSFFSRYGDDAYVQFARAIAREQRQAGRQDTLARSALEHAYNGGRTMNLDEVQPYTLNGQTAPGRPQDVYGAIMAQDIVLNPNSTEVRSSIPREVVRGISRSNPTIVSREQAEGNSGRAVALGDTQGYMAGYYAYGAANERDPRMRGHGSSYSQIVPNYDENARRQFPAASSQVFQPGRPDLPVAAGYALGYDQSQNDARYRYENVDDNLHGAPPRAPGANAGAGTGRSTPPPLPPRY